jgi:hypothetical protein
MSDITDKTEQRQPQPMDTGRLAHIRSLHADQWILSWDDVGDLFKDRDYHAQRADAAEKNYAFMVQRAADQHLDGYRELGQRAADAERERDNAADNCRAVLVERNQLQRELDDALAEVERLRADVLAGSASTGTA